MARLTKEQKEYAQKTANDLFDYESRAEKHAAFLRSDPNQYAVAYEAYLQKAPPMGFIPADDQLAQAMAHSEDFLLAKKCETFAEHLQAMNSAYLLNEFSTARMIFGVAPSSMKSIDLTSSTLISSGDAPIAPTTASHKNAAGYPLTIPGCPKFTDTEIPPCSRVPVTSEQVAIWKANPFQLLQEIFFSKESGDDLEAFKVSSVTLMLPSHIFYILYQDEDEAVGLLNDAFFELVSRSECIVR
ncbi:hypothetical protein C8R44DRAFT_980258 [Mycena epipterygia]|nr:hypothetical protein C8R44DRAFT_980258 [Mycena epipterygia]